MLGFNDTSTLVGHFVSSPREREMRGPSGPEIAHLDYAIMICYIVPCWPSWLSDQIAFSNSESDVF